MKGPARWTHYHLYAILDIFSRYVVGWTVHLRESAAVAEALIAQACEQQAIRRDRLTLHADRQAVLSAAYAASPERFVRGAPKPSTLPSAAWINKPDPEEVAH